MKEAFFKVLISIITNLLAYIIKYVCKDVDGNGIPDFIDKIETLVKAKFGK